MCAAGTKGGVKGWEGTCAAGSCGADTQVQVGTVGLSPSPVAPVNRRWFPGAF